MSMLYFSCFPSKPFLMLANEDASDYMNSFEKMHQKEITADNILENIIDTVSDAIPRKKAGRFFDDGASSVSAGMDRLLGRQKSVHHIFGGGKSADVLLWRNKKISSSVLVGATLIWVLFEWLEYHFLGLVCFAFIAGIAAQFAFSNAFIIMNRSPSEVPRLVLPKDLFVNVAVSVGDQINIFLGFIQDVAIRRDLKQFVIVVLCLLVVAVIGSWFNFLTVIYVGFVSAHTLPVLYEKYEDQVDEFIYNLFGKLQNQYQRLDSGLLSKIPKSNPKNRKAD